VADPDEVTDAHQAAQLSIVHSIGERVAAQQDRVGGE
jgi:hypothetical protein